MLDFVWNMFQECISEMDCMYVLDVFVKASDRHVEILETHGEL